MSPRYVDAARTTIRHNGADIPVAPGNVDFDALIASGVPIEPFTPPAISADDVRAEAGRRVLARYPIHAQLNANARATELVLIGAANWSDTERAEADALREMRAWIKAVRDASNAIENTPPADFADDKHWPAAR